MAMGNSFEDWFPLALLTDCERHSFDFEDVQVILGKDSLVVKHICLDFL